MSVSKETIQLSKLLQSCVTAATVASVAIRKVMVGGELDVQFKGVNDPQTLADLTAQALIAETLRAEFPNLCIVGEEDDYIEEGKLDVDLEKYPIELVTLPEFEEQELALNDVTVWVDPLDGTREFTRGDVMAVTVLIGVAIDGVAEAGVIAQPFFKDGCECNHICVDCSTGNESITEATRATDDEFEKGIDVGRQFFGAKQAGGIFSRHGETGEFSQINIGEGLNQRVVTSRTHFTDDVKQAFERVQVESIHRVGGAGNKVIMMLEDQADMWIYPCNGTSKWDVCAAHGILSAIGGGLTDVFGKTYSYLPDVEHKNQQGVIAFLNEKNTALEMLHNNLVVTKKF